MNGRFDEPLRDLPQEASIDIYCRHCQRALTLSVRALIELAGPEITLRRVADAARCKDCGRKAASAYETPAPVSDVKTQWDLTTHGYGMPVEETPRSGLRRR